MVNGPITSSCFSGVASLLATRKSAPLAPAVEVGGDIRNLSGRSFNHLGIGKPPVSWNRMSAVDATSGNAS